MNQNIEFKAVDNAILIPHDWAHLATGNLNVFNMALIPLDSGYLATYRFVSGADLARRIASCLLDENQEPVSGSARPLSDKIEFARSDVPKQSKVWFADPRLFRLQGKVFMVWNNGHTEDGSNNQYMVELDDQGNPAGKAREIVLRAARRKTEKNWAFFEAEGKIWAVYSVSPHRILRVDMDSSTTEVLCDIDNIASWKPVYSEVFGAFRGGAQPIQVGDKFVNVVHSRYNMPDGAEYVPAVYEFSAMYPFHPVRELPYPVSLNFDPHTDPSAHGFPDEVKEDLNPTTSWVIYPTGFAFSEGKFVISGGFNDAHCFTATGPLEHLQAGMRNVKSSPQPTILPVNSIDGSLIRDKYAQTTNSELPLFWWLAKDRVMSPKISHQVFQFGNFGDDASELLIKRLTGFTPIQPETDQNKLLAIGSILHRAISGDVVWGSGLKGTDALDNHPGGDIFVRAVRGPMTLDVLKKAGWDISHITELFDPGALLAHLWKNELTKHQLEKNSSKGKIRIVPHFRDELVFKRWNPHLHHHFVSADNHPLTVLKQMLGAELVISSSLHGIIFAESLGIPAIWIDSPGKEAHFKYLDYYASTGRTNIKAVANIQEALKANAPEVPKFDFEKLLATFPKKEIADLADRAKPKFQGVLFAAQDFNTANQKFGVSWGKNMISRPDGTWLKGLSGSFTIAPKSLVTGYGSIRIQLKRCDTRLSLSNQEVTLSTSAGSQATVKWSKNDFRSKEIVLPISQDSVSEGLTVHLKAKVLGPIQNWLSPLPLGSVGVVSVRSD
ncbi:MAG: polysaccharide pyruvyl transferase family protein [Rhodoluna sp.]